MSLSDDQIKIAMAECGWPGRWDGRPETRQGAVEFLAWRAAHLAKRQGAVARKMKTVREAAKAFCQGQRFDAAAAYAEARMAKVAERKTEARVAELEAAIRQHRDERGDDRCHADDGRLYAVLPEGDTRPARETAVTLENCQKYIECRQQGREYVSPLRRVEELEGQLHKAEARVAELEACIERRDGGRATYTIDEASRTVTLLASDVSGETHVFGEFDEPPSRLDWRRDVARLMPLGFAVAWLAARDELIRRKLIEVRA